MYFYFVYILRCKDGSYYTGITNNVERRLREHNAGKYEGSYTHSRRPVELVFSIEFTNVHKAIAFEKQVKGWSRKKKEAIIKDQWHLLHGLAACQNDTHYARNQNMPSKPGETEVSLYSQQKRNDMMVLVLGASGQLGNCLRKVASERNFDGILFPSEEEGNILSPELLETLFSKEKPSFVINCAAYTAVDKAEDEQDICRKVNRDGAANIATACAAHGATLIHISTDFVFKGDIPQLLSETDPAEPENIYGLTKLEGEVAVAAILPQHFTIRTSWLYSEFGNNFVKTMLRLGKERDQLGVIVDQAGSPTYAIDLAGCILDIIGSGSDAYGVYHYSNEGMTSWFDFAKTIFGISKVNVRVNPVKTSEYITKAVRPAYSVMDKSKIKAAFGVEIPYWRDSLEVCLEALGEKV